MYVYTHTFNEQPPCTGPSDTESPALPCTSEPQPTEQREALWEGSLSWKGGISSGERRAVHQRAPAPGGAGGTGLRMGLLEPSRVSPSEPAGSARGEALEPGAPGGKVLPVLAELRERASEAGTVFI